MHLSVNGRNIGYIVDGVYILINDTVPGTGASSPVDLKDRANIILIDRLFRDIQRELSDVYNPSDAMKIYSIAFRRGCEHGIKNYELKEASL